MSEIIYSLEKKRPFQLELKVEILFTCFKVIFISVLAGGLVGWSIVLYTKRLWGNRAHTYIADQSSVGVHMEGNQLMFLTSASLSSPFSLFKINKHISGED